MIRLRNADGIYSTEVPIGNLLWVDRINGNDALAARGRMTIPFRSLSAAKNAAQAGDTINVLPATYKDQDLVKTGVSWHFLSGAKVVGQASAKAIFLVDQPGTSRITGEGEFIAGAASNVLSVTNPEADVLFRAVRAEGVEAAINVKDGKSVSVEADVLESVGPPVQVQGGMVSVEARQIVCEQDTAILIQGGETVIKAHRVSSEAGSGIVVRGGSLIASVSILSTTDGIAVMTSGGSGILTCLNLKSANGLAIQLTGGSLVVEGADIYSGSGSGAAIKIGSDGLILRNCWINTKAPASIGTNGAPQRCRIFATAANVGADGNITQLVSTLLTDTEVKK